MQLVRYLLSLISYLLSPRKPVYMDHAAATPFRNEAAEAMYAVKHLFGNPGSSHQHGADAKRIYEDARARIAKVLAVKSQDIIVAASATEANNLAILGRLRNVRSQQKAESRKPHFITTAIEHSSVLEVFACKEMQENADITILPVDSTGMVHMSELQKALRPETVFISIGWANGEVGQVQPMRSLVKVVREHEETTHEERAKLSVAQKIVVHTDAGQAMFAHSPQPQGIGVDMMTLSSGKLYGPRGVAILYKPLDIPLQPIMYGGHQESGLRPGTEDVLPIVGFAKALELLNAERKDEYIRVLRLRSFFVEKARAVSSKNQHVKIEENGQSRDSLPHIINISVQIEGKPIDSEYVLLALDHKGISISTKSVCLESTGEPVSHVVRAMYPTTEDSWRASSTLRFSFGRCTTESDVRYAVKCLEEVLVAYKQ